MRARTLCLAIVICGSATPVLAQPPAPPKIWTVALSAGLALTSGNTDTSTVNLAYDV